MTPPVGGHSCNEAIIPRFHRAVCDYSTLGGQLKTYGNSACCAPAASGHGADGSVSSAARRQRVGAPSGRARRQRRPTSRPPMTMPHFAAISSCRESQRRYSRSARGTISCGLQLWVVIAIRPPQAPGRTRACAVVTLAAEKRLFGKCVAGTPSGDTFRQKVLRYHQTARSVLNRGGGRPLKVAARDQQEASSRHPEAHLRRRHAAAGAPIGPGARKDAHPRRHGGDELRLRPRHLHGAAPAFAGDRSLCQVGAASAGLRRGAHARGDARRALRSSSSGAVTTRPA